MRTSTLGIRLTRRAVAAVLMDDEIISFHDARYLGSARSQATAALERYLQRVVPLLKPSAVVIDAPHSPGSTTEELFRTAHRAIAGIGLDTRSVSVSEILASFGLPGLRSRTELFRVTEQFWPELGEVRTKLKAYVVDAAGAALHAQTVDALGRPPPP